VPLNDTSLAAQAIQFEIYRRMSGEQRLAIAFEMSDFCRELAKEGIRRDHPDWPEARITRELIRLTLLPQPLPARLR